MRTIEFPSLAIRGGTLAVVWNDGRLTGHSHILLATRPLSGGTWTLRFITQGSGDEVQPAITSDADGWHITYYARTGRNLAVDQATSADAVDWTVQTITSRSFPGVFTVPQFDPIIAEGYMGDYLSSMSVGGRRYFAWGDNRDIVTNTELVSIQGQRYSSGTRWVCSGCRSSRSRSTSSTGTTRSTMTSAGSSVMTRSARCARR